MSQTTLFRNYRRSRLFIAAAIVFGATAFGAVGFWLIEGWSIIDSLYMTVMTLTTVGFGEVHPLSTGGRLFAILLMLMGVGAVTFAFATVLQVVVKSEVLKAMGFRSRFREMRKLKDHFIICGAGRMGSHIVRDVERTGDEFVVIEKDSEKVSEMLERKIPHVIHGDATLEGILREAGVERARALVACLSDDADNVYTVLVARDLHPGLHIVARAIEEQAEPRLIRAGADRVIAPTIIGGRKMAVAMRNPAIDDLLDSVSTGELDLQARHVAIDVSSDLAGQKLSSTHLKTGLNVVVVSIQRPNGEAVFNPTGDFVFEPGDIVFAIGSDESLEHLRIRASGQSPEI